MASPVPISVPNLMQITQPEAMGVTSRRKKQHPMREDWECEDAPSGGFIGWPKDSRPSIQAHHIDGPLLHFRNGELHWLTPWERVLLWFGKTDAYALECKHRPHLAEQLPQLNKER